MWARTKLTGKISTSQFTFDYSTPLSRASSTPMGHGEDMRFSFFSAFFFKLRKNPVVWAWKSFFIVEQIATCRRNYVYVWKTPATTQLDDIFRWLVVGGSFYSVSCLVFCVVDRILPQQSRKRSTAGPIKHLNRQQRLIAFDDWASDVKGKAKLKTSTVKWLKPPEHMSQQQQRKHRLEGVRIA